MADTHSGYLVGQFTSEILADTPTDHSVGQNILAVILAFEKAQKRMVLLREQLKERSHV